MNISYFNRKRIVGMLSVVCFILLLFAQCKKDKSQLGLNVQPQSDQIGLMVSDTSTLHTYSTLSDSIATDELNAAALLGSYMDPFFGKVSASIYTQIRLAGSVDFTPEGGTLADLEVDSVVLYLVISGGYGNLDAQTFEVYQMEENIFMDFTYYSNKVIPNTGLNLVPIGEGTIVPNASAPGFVGGVQTNNPILRIPLSVNDFAMPIINQSGIGPLISNDGDNGFVSWFKGLYITTNTNQEINEGSILYLDLLSPNSKVTMFYRDNSGLPSEYDTLRFDFNINASCARFGNYQHDYTGTPVEAQLNDTTLGQQLFYLQAMGGVRGNIALPNVERYKDSGNIIINKAELVIPVQYYTTDAYLPPSELFLVRQLPDVGIAFIPDYNDSRGGNYVASTKSYTFNITRYLNQLIAGEYENRPLTIVTSGNAVTANRVVFNGAQTTLKDKPKLIITYSKFE
jgi:hypothetical protein